MPHTDTRDPSVVDWTHALEEDDTLELPATEPAYMMHGIARRAGMALAPVALALVVLLAIILTACRADARQVEPPTHHVHHVRVTYAERTGEAGTRLYLETSDGAAYRVRPCESEDEPHACYWDARVRGNGIGHSFARLRGDVVRIPARIMRRA